MDKPIKKFTFLKERKLIERLDVFENYRKKIADIMKAEDLQIDWFGLHEPEPIEDLPFLL